MAKALGVTRTLVATCLFSFACLFTSMSDANDRLSQLPSGAFTVVIIPDTQHYLGAGTKLSRNAAKQSKSVDESVDSKKLPNTGDNAAVTNPYLERHVDWIVANHKAENIVFVSHVGDIVEMDRPVEWAVAKKHLDRLGGVVPFGLTVGNHDMNSKGDARHFQAAFPAASFRKYDWYVDTFAGTHGDSHVSANNVNSAQRFSAGGIDFLFVHLECNAPDDVLAWANDLIAANKQRRVLISTHMDLGIIDRPKNQAGYIHDPKGRMRWVKIHGKRGNTAEQMWDKLYRKHANIDFVFSGDQSRVTARKLVAPGDAGNRVTSLLSDYMSLGGLRLLRFVPSSNAVNVVTYDTTNDKLIESMPYVPDRDEHQFNLPYDHFISRH